MQKLTLRGQRNQCPTCREYFNSNYAFDFHRTGDFGKKTRRCLTVGEMTEKGMFRSEPGWWYSKAYPLAGADHVS